MSIDQLSSWAASLATEHFAAFAAGERVMVATDSVVERGSLGVEAGMTRDLVAAYEVWPAIELADAIVERTSVGRRRRLVLVFSRR